MKRLLGLVVVFAVLACFAGCSVRYQKGSDGSMEVVIEKADK